MNDYLNTIQAEHQTYIPGEQRGLDAERRKREGLLIPDDVWKLLNKYDAKSVIMFSRKINFAFINHKEKHE